MEAPQVIYGFIPHSPATIGLRRKSLSASQILIDMQQVAERMKEFVDRHRTPRAFQESDRVFLYVPLDSSLTVVIKKISDVAYKLQLPDHCKVHPVFHVSKLRPYISRDENFEDGLLLDKREWKIRNRSIPEYLVAWTSRSLTDATWELEALICKHFPSLITEDSDL
ncbi:hypothetical protein KP509_01G081100 [Ceratopteris richardii]|uniref:Chromo domain-containing protein n=1 Tax=Ceratopteris richardii TaxID=49495 RepID=A0A8T2VHV9_CERRI|nr:hypothetical protein KP509_01G081100 [Ceratopteris richardii]